MATKDHNGEAERRVRRSPDQVRQLLLDAARAAFATNGYAGTSTREISERAGVSEALLFRHFGTKAQLFQRAIFDPFNEFVNSYLEDWREHLAPSLEPAEVPSRNYVAGLYDLLREHRELVMALVAAHAYEVGVAENGEQAMLSGVLDRLQDVVEAEVARRGFTGVDIPVAIRLTFGMVMAMSVLDEWLFTPDRHRPSRDRIVNEMVGFMVHGLAHRDEAAPPATKG
ncbi:MAG: TetR/AcrR family transcriptional regulator [bacterium]